MRAWTDAELHRLATASSLRLSAGSSDKVAVELGMVLVAQNLFVRAFAGRRSRWFEAAATAGVGLIEVDGDVIPVRLEVSAGDDREIEAAYRARYGAAADLVSTRAARGATLLITADSPR